VGCALMDYSELTQTFQQDGNPVTLPASTIDSLTESLPEPPPLQAVPPAESPPAPESAKGSKAVPLEEKTENGKVQDKEKGPQEKEKKEPWYSVHEQGTIVTQKHDHFRSPYEGPNSLRSAEPAATTETATLFLDARL